MSDFSRGFGVALAVMGTGVAVGSAVVAGGIGYAANKLYFEPHSRAEEFNARARNVLASQSLKTISLEDFKQGDDGCAAPLYGTKFIAENAQGSVVRGSMCVSRRTEVTFRFNR